MSSQGSDRTGVQNPVDPGIASAVATVRRLENRLSYTDEPAQFLKMLEREAGNDPRGGCEV
jgi:hypothetical protein